MSCALIDTISPPNRFLGGCCHASQTFPMQISAHILLYLPYNKSVQVSILRSSSLLPNEIWSHCTNEEMKCIALKFPAKSVYAPLSLAMNEIIVAEMCVKPLCHQKKSETYSKARVIEEWPTQASFERSSISHCKADSGPEPQYIVRAANSNSFVPSCRRPTYRRSVPRDLRMKCRCSSFWCIRTFCCRCEECWYVCYFG